MRANPDRAAHGQIFTRPDVRCFSRVVSFGTAKWVVPPLPKTPVTLLASWSFESKSEALQAERKIKRLPREQKWRLIAQRLVS